MDSAIVVTTYNHYDVTRTCLDTLTHTVGNELPVFVIDDNSTDATKTKLPKQFPWIVFDSDDRLSLSQMWNVGIHYFLETDYDHVTIINNDIQFTQRDWLKHLLRTFELYPETGMVGPRSFKPDGHRENKGIPSWGYRMRRPTHNGKIYYKTPMPKARFNEYKPIGKSWVVREHNGIFPVTDTYGGCFTLSRECIEEVGEFDNLLAFACDEYDYAWRCWEKDYWVMFNTNSHIRHLGGTERINNGTYDILIRKSELFDIAYKRPTVIYNEKHPLEKRKNLWEKKIRPLLKERFGIDHFT